MKNSTQFDSDIKEKNSFQPKTNKFFFWSTLITFLLTASIFTPAAYYFGQQNGFNNFEQDKPTVVPSSTPAETKVSKESPSPTLVLNDLKEEIGQIKSIFNQDGKNYLTIDYVQWLSKSAGECRYEFDLESELPACNPNGHLVLNENPKLRTFEISDEVLIDFSSFDNIGLMWKNDQPLNKTNLSLAEFKTIFDNSNEDIAWLKNALYWIKLDVDRVVEIKHQYQP